MGSLNATMWLPSKLKPNSFSHQHFYSHSAFPVMRLFGQVKFEASKLKVKYLGGVEEKKHPASLPRTYTLTHSDLTSHLTLAISPSINFSQIEGWYNKMYRDEVVGEWKKVKGKMGLYLHCHISGSHFLLHFFASLRYNIFSKELPLVLKAFEHGDENLLNEYQELKDSMVWVYFHSNLPEFNKVECWGPLRQPLGPTANHRFCRHQPPEPCKGPCRCCFAPVTGYDPMVSPIPSSPCTANLYVI